LQPWFPLRSAGVKTVLSLTERRAQVTSSEPTMSTRSSAHAASTLSTATTWSHTPPNPSTTTRAARCGRRRTASGSFARDRRTRCAQSRSKHFIGATCRRTPATSTWAAEHGPSLAKSTAAHLRSPLCTTYDFKYYLKCGCLDNIHHWCIRGVSFIISALGEPCQALCDTCVAVVDLSPIPDVRNISPSPLAFSAFLYRLCL
jgi:hypothetical protein